MAKGNGKNAKARNAQISKLTRNDKHSKTDKNHQINWPIPFFVGQRQSLWTGHLTTNFSDHVEVKAKSKMYS